MLQQKEEEHLCALMLMMSEYMERKASELKKVKGLELLAGTECPSSSHHPPSHSVSSPYSLLTGSGASFLHSALEIKW